MKDYFLPFFVFILLLSESRISKLKGQENFNSATQFCVSHTAPPPPGSASLGKYTNMPVNLYAGKPVIDIPLWEIKSRTLSVPLSLSYNSSGIKVQEVSDWLGIGWALMGQGVITRSLRGKPDDQGNGYLTVGYEIPDDINQLYSSSSYTLDQCQSLADGRLDYEPDIYTFNFLGHSGEIVFDFDSSGIKPYVTPYQDLKITFTRGNSSGSGIHTWTIIDETGTTYIFGSEVPDSAIEICQYDQGLCGSEASPLYFSSWFLKKIISPSKGDTIDFFYQTLTEQFDFIGASEYQNVRLQIPNCSDLPGVNTVFPESEFGACPNSMVLSPTHKLKSIRTASTIVDFATDSTIAIPAGVKLNSIKIKDRSTNELVRTFSFYYSYTYAQFIPTPWYNNPIGAGDDLKYRLWLDSVSEEYSGVKKTYKMFYNNRNSLPARNSWKIDHWGYLNSNMGTFEGYYTLLPLTNLSGTTYGGADRGCDTNTVTSGMIDSIIYPTGGYSKFYYESNDFFHVQGGGTITTILFENMSASAVHQCEQGNFDTAYTYFYVDHDQYADFSFMTEKCENVVDPVSTYVGVQSLDNSFSRGWGGGAGVPLTHKSVWLALGHYRLYAYIDAIGYRLGEITASWQSCDTTTSQDTLYYQYGGGVRIKRIVDFDGRQASIRHFIYRLSSNSLKSSGYLMGAIPAYISNYIKNYGYTCNMNDICTCSCPYLTISSNTTRQQETTQGNHVGYSEVTELLGENGENGKIIHSYYVCSDIGGDYFPFPPKTSNEWKRGMEKATRTYDKNDTLRKEEFNLYQTTERDSPVNFHSIGAVKIGWRSKWCGMGVQPVDWLFEFSFGQYEIYCGWKYKYKKITITYDTIGLNPVYDSTDFLYEHPNHHLQVTKTSNINSNGVERITRYRYPKDYSGNGSDDYAYAITMMRDSLHMVNSVIEYLESIRKPTDTAELVMGGNIFLYKRFPPSDFLAIHPFKSIGLETTTPISFSSFTKSNINGSGTFVYDSHFLTNKVTYDNFDRFGNLLHYFLTDNIPISFNWGHNNTLILTKAVNSSYDPTNSYSNSSIQVTRYEYDHPLIGISRIINPNGKSTYYEYDPLGRLNLIKNDDHKILQKTDYHYKTN